MIRSTLFGLGTLADLFVRGMLTRGRDVEALRRDLANTKLLADTLLARARTAEDECDGAWRRLRELGHDLADAEQRRNILVHRAEEAETELARGIAEAHRSDEIHREIARDAEERRAKAESDAQRWHSEAMALSAGSQRLERDLADAKAKLALYERGEAGTRAMGGEA